MTNANVYFVHPSNIIIAGPTMSGKTQFLVEVLRRQLIDPFPERIIWFYGQWQKAYDELKTFLPDIEFFKGFDPEMAD